MASASLGGSAVRHAHESGGQVSSPACVRPAGWVRLRAWLSELYRAEFETSVAANLGSPLAVCGPALARLAVPGGFRGLDRVVAGFLSDERLRRVFTFQSLYAGVSPQRALALYAVIAYMDTVAGWSTTSSTPHRRAV